jgi:anti-anti-sigma regulatory factor
MNSSLPRPDEIVLRPYGRLDPLGARAMLAMVPSERPTPGSRAGAVVLDLRSVTHVSPGAFAAVIACRRRAWRAGTTLRLRCDPGPVLEEFQRAGLHRVFEIDTA